MTAEQEKMRPNPPASLREKVHEALFDISSRNGKRVALIIQALILLSVFSISLGTFQNLPNNIKNLLHTLDLIIVYSFTIEFVLRVWVARDRLSYLFSPWGLIDALAVVPYWLVGADVLAVRAFRLLRIVHVLRFSRAARALEHFSHAWRLVRHEIRMFLGMSLIFLYLVALGIWHFEHAAQPEKYANIFDALWWAVVSLTTVGYGDVYPVTVGGRLFTMLVLFVGIGIVAVPSGLLASAFHEIRREELLRAQGDAAHMPDEPVKEDERRARKNDPGAKE
ncbi:ion transporter [Thermopetrobacter sp. TC1]|uniref:ion transporter n=1 Tax=Thermopetrobacter sp. TC1 TaxID=1495045 RepID=UPI00068A0F39|nr:ion transporter [Thermopetrobacter sp. TC1]